MHYYKNSLFSVLCIIRISNPTWNWRLATFARQTSKYSTSTARGKSKLCDQRTAFCLRRCTTHTQESLSHREKKRAAVCRRRRLSVSAASQQTNTLCAQDAVSVCVCFYWQNFSSRRRGIKSYKATLRCWVSRRSFAGARSLHWTPFYNAACASEWKRERRASKLWRPIDMHNNRPGCVARRGDSCTLYIYAN